MTLDNNQPSTHSTKRASEFGKLTNTEVKQAKPKEKPYRMPDGGNLYLEISPKGAKRWFLKYFFADKENRLALGVYPTITIATARDRARDAKAQLANGIDPNDAKRQTKLARAIATGNSFEVVATEWYAKQSLHWSLSHKTRTMGILRHNLCQWIGKRPISDITVPELLA
ncbi:MAG TPA: Arm DNA-binding domain-containing protein, partial [Pseudomonadales bacterium]|nr:Arm DNA-binding domain-containing protein [Pseudomonadales bacterium]